MQDSQESVGDMKEAASPTAEPATAENFSEASCLPFFSGLALSSAFLQSASLGMRCSAFLENSYPEL